MFSGNYPFQAVESRAFAQWAQNYTSGGTQRIYGLLDLHSYSQQSRSMPGFLQEEQRLTPQSSILIPIPATSLLQILRILKS